MTALEKIYSGKPFIFHSPFQDTPGWEDGDVGILVRQNMAIRGDAVDGHIEDLWVGYHIEDDAFYDLWGGEAFDDKKAPIVREHRFMNWKPT